MYCLRVMATKAAVFVDRALSRVLLVGLKIFREYPVAVTDKCLQTNLTLLFYF